MVEPLLVAIRSRQPEDLLKKRVALSHEPATVCTVPRWRQYKLGRFEHAKWGKCEVRPNGLRLRRRRYDARCRAGRTYSG